MAFLLMAKRKPCGHRSDRCKCLGMISSKSKYRFKTLRRGIATSRVWRPRCCKELAMVPNQMEAVETGWTERSIAILILLTLTGVSIIPCWSTREGKLRVNLRSKEAHKVLTKLQLITNKVPPKALLVKKSPKSLPMTFHPFRPATDNSGFKDSKYCLRSQTVIKLLI